MCIFVNHQMHVAVESGTGIPARRLMLVFQPDGQCIGALRLQVGRHVEVERIVAIRPIAHFLSVDPHTGMAHGSVEDKRSRLALPEIGSLEFQPVPAGSYERQTAGTSGMLHGFFLSVLRDSQILLVVLHTEGAVDGPVVRYGDRLPFSVVKLRGTETLFICSGKLPPFLECLLDAHLRPHGLRQQCCRQDPKKSNVFHTEKCNSLIIRQR